MTLPSIRELVRDYCRAGQTLTRTQLAEFALVLEVRERLKERDTMSCICHGTFSPDCPDHGAGVRAAREINAIADRIDERDAALVAANLETLIVQALDGVEIPPRALHGLAELLRARERAIRAEVEV